MIRSVAVVVLPGLSPFEFGVVCEVFALDRSKLGVGLPAFDFRICTTEPGLVPTSAGYSMQVDLDLSAARDVDLLVMAPFHGGAAVPQPVIDLLREADARRGRILSVCEGALSLAAAGILDGRRATTHWMHSQRMAAEFPLVDVDENVLYVEDGNIITSAGTAAGIDACLHLIRNEFGTKAASAIARGMVVPPHREGGQLQFIDRPVHAPGDGGMGPLLSWISGHLDQDLGVAELAERMHMSERNFARRFKAETGATPAAWVVSQRLLTARSLLENTESSVDEVARLSGFGQAVLLRHHFQRALGTSPAAYRRLFRGRERKNRPPVATP